MAHADDERAGAAGGLRRVLGPVDATCVVIGAIIGVGIFFTPGRVALLAGSGGLALAAWAIGGAIVLLLAAGTAVVDTLLTGVVFIDAVFFALTGFAVIVLRRRRPDAERPVRCPGYPLVPLAFVAGELAVLAGAYVDPAVRRAAFIGLAWIALAAVCYAAFFRQRAPASSPLKNSRGLRAVQIRQLCVAESRRISLDMPSIRLLDLTNLVALSPAREFFNGLLEQEPLSGQDSIDSRHHVGAMPATRAAVQTRRKRL